MTPPLTDAELLAYIERTPELVKMGEVGLYFDAIGYVARAFHAHEQRVREEERKIISAGVAFIMGPGGDEGTRMGLHPDSPYRETVDEQGEAAEVVGLLAEADALEVELRSEPFNASGFLTRAAIKDLRRRARAILTKQGGK